MMTQSASLNSHPLQTKVLNSLSSESSLNAGDAIQLRNHLTVGAPVEHVLQVSNAVVTKATKSQINQDFTNFTTAKTAIHLLTKASSDSDKEVQSRIQINDSGQRQVIPSPKNDCKDRHLSFFNSLSLAYKIQNHDDEWEYTEEPHVIRRKVSVFTIA